MDYQYDKFYKLTANYFSYDNYKKEINDKKLFSRIKCDKVYYSRAYLKMTDILNKYCN